MSRISLLSKFGGYALSLMLVVAATIGAAGSQAAGIGVASLAPTMMLAVHATAPDGALPAGLAGYAPLTAGFDTAKAVQAGAWGADASGAGVATAAEWSATPQSTAGATVTANDEFGNITASAAAREDALIAGFGALAIDVAT